ncbi:MAG: transcriptional regulator YeiL [Erysipelotrichaceae bacterium]|nr:transcriptional regulator YeiL [Erysipelotrichaceae bacterium]
MQKITDREKLKKYLELPAVRRYFSRDLDEFFQLVSSRPGEQIIFQGVKSDYLYFLLFGRCKVSAVMENGRTVIVNSLAAPCLVGEIELINQDVPFSVEILTEAQLLALPVAVCRQRLLSSPDFLLQLCCDLVGKERTNAIKLAHYISFPLENRLAQFILNNSSEDGLRIKKTVIAESLGVSYRHLEKVMNDLVAKGVLSKSGKQYRIIRRPYLQQLADAMEVF